MSRSTTRDSQLFTTQSNRPYKQTHVREAYCIVRAIANQLDRPTRSFEILLSGHQYNLLFRSLPEGQGSLAKTDSNWVTFHHFTFHIFLKFLVSHFNFLFVPCGGLSWLPVSFLLHVKYTLSYRIVSYIIY